MSMVSAFQSYAEVLSKKVASHAPLQEVGNPRTHVDGVDIELYANPEQITDEWREFENHAGGCLFHSYRWIETWARQASATAGEELAIAVGRDKSGKTLFIWPLAIVSIFGTKCLSWCAQSHSNYHAPNTDREFAKNVNGQKLEALLKAIANLTPGVSAIYFQNQPVNWAKWPNPFYKLPHIKSANSSYTIKLTENFEELRNAQLGKSGQRNIRRKEKKLASFGEMKFSTTHGTYTRLDILEQFFTQKEAQFKDAGITNIFSSPTLRAFYRDLVAGGEEADESFELYTLHINDELLATFNGMTYQGRFYLLLSSMTQEEYRKWSPGLVLMQRHIQHNCEEGRNAYDLGTGAGDHKSIWTNETVPLFDTFLPINAKGYLCGALLGIKTAAKRKIKNNPKLWSIAKDMRQKIGKLKANA